MMCVNESDVEAMHICMCVWEKCLQNSLSVTHNMQSEQTKENLSQDLVLSNQHQFMKHKVRDFVGL